MPRCPVAPVARVRCCSVRTAPRSRCHWAWTFADRRLARVVGAGVTWRASRPGVPDRVRAGPRQLRCPGRHRGDRRGGRRGRPRRPRRRPAEHGARLLHAGRPPACHGRRARPGWRPRAGGRRRRPRAADRGSRRLGPDGAGRLVRGVPRRCRPRRLAGTPGRAARRQRDRCGRRRPGAGPARCRGDRRPGRRHGARRRGPGGRDAPVVGGGGRCRGPPWH